MKRITFIIIIFAAMILTTCVSFPPLATIDSDGKSIELRVDKEFKKIEEFVIIKKAVLSPDKKYLLLINFGGEYILFDTYNNKIVNNIKKSEELNSIKTPYCKGFREYGDLQYTSSNKRFQVQITGTNKNNPFNQNNNNDPEHINAFINEMEVHDTMSGQKSTISKPVLWFFGKDKYALTRIEGTKGFLCFVSLPEMKEIVKYESTLTISVWDAKKYCSSLSSDANNDILVKHNGRLVQFYDFKNTQYLGSIVLIDNKNWFVTSASGEYDGTDETFHLFSWDLGKEKISVNKFDKSFRNKNILGKLFGLQKQQSTISSINLAKQLMGTVRQIQGNEIVVGSGRAAENLKMGDKVFIIVNGEKIELEVFFPMMTLAKCRILKSKKGFANLIAVGMPVFK